MRPPSCLKIGGKDSKMSKSTKVARKSASNKGQAKGARTPKAADSAKGARPTRKATFVVTKTKSGTRVFHAVNKRAHKLATKVGKRSILSPAELKKALTMRPNLRAYQYTGADNKQLKPIKF